MKKVYLDKLPHKGKSICWSNSIGFEIPFEYEEISGTMTIVGIDNSKKSVVLEYLGEKYTVTTGKLTKNGISRILGVKYGKRKNQYAIGETINNKKILNIIYKNNRAQYGFECLKCGQINFQTKYNFVNCGCPVCNNKIIIHDINGIKSQYPDIYAIITDKDKDLYGSKSNHKVHWNCPYCTNQNFTQILHLTESIDKNIPLPCIFCKKSFSIGESILYGVLCQAVNQFDSHIKFEWSCNKEYDAHVDGIIIEMHGLQHYKQIKGERYRPLLEIQMNDEYKKYLAETYYADLKAYIVIDCRFSDFNYIKTNIINSGLDKLLNFNFNEINWEHIALQIKEGMYKKVSDLYNNGVHQDEIAKILNISRDTVYKHLKFCNKLHLINCTTKHATKHKRRKTRCKNTGEIFQSCTDAALWCGLKSSSSIGSCCNNINGFQTAGKHPITGEKLYWEYVV